MAVGLKLKPLSAPPKKVAMSYERIDALTPDPRNPRIHTRSQIKQIAASMRAFGPVVPLLADRTGMVIAGHGRLEAARSLGLTELPVVRLEDLSPEQARALAIADNRLVERGRWDDGLLAIHLQELSGLDLDFALEVTGFTVAEIDLKIESLNAPPDEPQEEAVPVGPAVTRPGDLWVLDRHRLLCADARDPASYVKLMEGVCAHVVLTDPPWDVPVSGHISGKGKRRHREFAMATGEMGGAAFTAFLSQFMGQLTAHSASGSVHFLCIDWRHVFEMIAAGRANYAEMLNLCVWVKTNGGMGSLYRSAHELVTVWRHGPGPHRNNVELGRFGRSRTNCWTYPGFSGLSRAEDADLSAQHPTPKNPTMIADALMDVSARGDVVLDPFMGSGATLLAAERVGRACRGMELDPLYVDLAIRRFRRLTGQTAFLAGSKKSFDAIEQEGRPMSRKAPNDGGEYEVGYGKPPVGTRFQKGASGNPRGRPKGSRGFNALLMEAMREKVVVTEGGRRRAVSKLEVTFKQLVNKAASGDPRATKLMLELVRTGEQEEAKTLPGETPEERIARNKLFMQALRSRAIGGGDDGEG